jgi:5-formyltetrahydrofolate cyclo-ligase
LLDKIQLRSQFKEKIENFSNEILIEWSSNIELHLLSLLNQLNHLKKSPSALGLYWPLSDEPALDWLTLKNDEPQKKLALPVVFDQEMKFIIWDGKRKTNWRGDGLSGESLKPEVVICPGLWFSQQGQRIGRGKGYYDRYFAKNLVNVKIGVCFHSFFREKWKDEEHDQIFDYVVTDQGVWKC